MMKKVFKVDVDKTWVCNFKRRQMKEFTQNKIKNLSDKRTGKTLEEDMEYFIMKFQNYVDSGINASGINLLDFDETRIGPLHSDKTVTKQFTFNQTGLKEAFQSTRNQIVGSMFHIKNLMKDKEEQKQQEKEENKERLRRSVSER